MSVLDIDERIEQADKQADLYLRWKVEDDVFQKKHPDSLIYLWFVEHSKTWKPEPSIVDDPLENRELTPLEEEYGKPHIKFGPGTPVFMIYFCCIAKYMVDITKPGIPPDKSKMPTSYTLTTFSKVVQLNQAHITISASDGTHVDFILRMPPVITLKNVTEWPDWLIDGRTRRCRQPWDNVTFWVDDSCDTAPISNLIYQPGVSYGDPAGYNFFRQSDYFLWF